MNHLAYTKTEYDLQVTALVKKQLVSGFSNGRQPLKKYNIHVLIIDGSIGLY